MLAFTGRSIDETSDILSSDLYFRRFARQRRTTMTQITQIITAARTDETVIRTTRVASENSKQLYFTKTLSLLCIIILGHLAFVKKQISGFML